MALTPFGKALRKLRIDKDMLLKEMADGAGVTPAFLSAVEVGRKAIPKNLVDRIADGTRLDAETRIQLRTAADLSASHVEIPLAGVSSMFDRTLAVQLARNFDTLDEGQKNSIKEIMDRRKA